MSAGGASGGGVGGVVDEHGVHEFSGDFFGAVEHRLDRGGPDEMREAPSRTTPVLISHQPVLGLTIVSSVNVVAARSTLNLRCQSR